jgi:hypothetical protein
LAVEAAAELVHRVALASDGANVQRPSTATQNQLGMRRHDMKLWALILSSSVVALGFGSDAEGATKRSKARVSKGYSADQYYYTTRSAVGRTRDGLCRFDNGVPLSELNLNDRCDYEEFWRRQRDRGNERIR